MSTFQRLSFLFTHKFRELEDEIEVFMKPIVSGLRLKIDNYAVFINRACEMP